MKLNQFLTVGVAAFVLSGCVAVSPGVPRPGIVQQPANAVEGNWLGTDGLAISTFRGGTFTSYATDTGNRLAVGNYTLRDQRNVSISLTSLIRNTTQQVNCLVVNTQQMNCTTQSGAQFSLIKTNQQPPAPAAPAPVVSSAPVVAPTLSTQVN